MQKQIKMDNSVIFQPDENLAWNFETTYSEGSTRTQSGTGRFTPLFTVEQLTYSVTGIPIADAATILQKIAKGYTFSLYYFSPYYGTWRTDTFYVGQSDGIDIGTLEENGEKLSRLSFKMTGVNPLV